MRALSRAAAELEFGPVQYGPDFESSTRLFGGIPFYVDERDMNGGFSDLLEALFEQEDGVEQLDDYGLLEQAWFCYLMRNSMSMVGEGVYHTFSHRASWSDVMSVEYAFHPVAAPASPRLEAESETADTAGSAAEPNPQGQ